MGKKEEILEKLKKAVETQDIDLARSAAQEALESGMKPLEAIENGLAKGMQTISDLFDEAKIFLPEILLSADAMETALKIFEPKMVGTGGESRGTIVIGTVAGDIHEIGKNVVAAMLKGAGYKVIDLGRDVPIENFVEKTKETSANLVGGSALMSTTLVGQREIVKGLNEAGIRDRVKVMFGGAPCTKEWVEKIGGDAYCPNAAEAAKIAAELIRR